MKTVQEHLKSCDRKSVIEAYFYAYLGCIAKEREDQSIKEIKQEYSEKLNKLIDTLTSVEPLHSEEEMIFLVTHCAPEDAGDIRNILIRREDINKEFATPYGYELDSFEEVAGYYIADTYLTQYYLNDMLAEILFETSLTGFEHENLERITNKIDAAIKEIEFFKDNPKYFITHEELKDRLETNLDVEFERRDSAEEEAMRDLIRHIAKYNVKCQQIELAKLRKLLG